MTSRSAVGEQPRQRRKGSSDTGRLTSFSVKGEAREPPYARRVVAAVSVPIHGIRSALLQSY